MSDLGAFEKWCKRKLMTLKDKPEDVEHLTGTIKYNIALATLDEFHKAVATHSHGNGNDKLKN